MLILVSVPNEGYVSKPYAKRIDSELLTEREIKVINQLKEKYGELKNGMCYMEKHYPRIYILDLEGN